MPNTKNIAPHTLINHVKIQTIPSFRSNRTFIGT